MNNFTGKVAVVTGAGSGIGRALALGLAQRGAKLAITDIDEKGLAETAALVAALGNEVESWRLDVSDREAFEACATQVLQRFGAVHQVYNNAGISVSRSILESGYTEYERVLGVNLWGVIYGTKTFLPHLIASGSGHVINVASLNGLMAYPNLSHYCASKFAVRGFTECLQMEMLTEGYPVIVTGVYPGGISTNITANAALLAKDLDVPFDEHRALSYNEKLLRMSPAIAAKTILDGVAARQSRVLIGNETRFVDRLIRSLPGLYPRAVVAFARKI